MEFLIKHCSHAQVILAARIRALTIAAVHAILRRILGRE